MKTLREYIDIVQEAESLLDPAAVKAITEKVNQSGLPELVQTQAYCYQSDSYGPGGEWGSRGDKASYSYVAREGTAYSNLAQLLDVLAKFSDKKYEWTEAEGELIESRTVSDMIDMDSVKEAMKESGEYDEYDDEDDLEQALDDNYSEFLEDNLDDTNLDFSDSEAQAIKIVWDDETITIDNKKIV